MKNHTVENKVFLDILSLFVTYGAGLQKRLSAGLLCARMRRAIGKSGRECITSPKLHRGVRLQMASMF